jgi:hypothetical protein
MRKNNLPEYGGSDFFTKLYFSITPVLATTVDASLKSLLFLWCFAPYGNFSFVAKGKKYCINMH